MNSDTVCNNRNFEVFLSFKNSDAEGQPTKDCLMATKLYAALTERGISTFFSNATLELLGAAEFKQVIDDALDQCVILIAIGTSQENITSQWVKYEWNSFSNDILSGLKPNGALFSYIESITPHMLPRTLRQCQVFESASSSIEDICNYIENALVARKEKENFTEVMKSVQIHTAHSWQSLAAKPGWPDSKAHVFHIHSSSNTDYSRPSTFPFFFTSQKLK